MADGSGSHRVLDEVVVNLDQPVVQVDAKSLPLPKGVGDGLPKKAFRKMAATGLQLQKDAMDSFYDESALLPTNGLPEA